MGSTLQHPREDLISAVLTKYPCRGPQIRALTTLLHVRICLPSRPVNHGDCAAASRQEESPRLTTALPHSPMQPSART